MSNTFINPSKNDKFSRLKGIDLQELLAETENYLLEYRNELGLPNELSFGVELEYEGVFKSSADNFIENNLCNWYSKDDGSLKYGGEITSPIMCDIPKYWNELLEVCKFLSKRKADTLHNAGGHIHIGANILGKDVEAWKLFLKLYTAYESTIFRFIYGDKISGRKKLLKYAPPISDLLYDEMNNFNKAKTISDITEDLPTERYAAINFGNVYLDNPERSHIKNTLEFRCPNATTSAVIWQNNINAFAKMLAASRNKVIDEDYLNYKLKDEYLPYSGNEYMYNNISLKNVLEFVDLVFENNLDKIYFLRQYLKDFQENYGAKNAIKARKFVK